MLYGEFYKEEGFPFRGRKLDRLNAFLQSCGLRYDESAEYTVLLTDADGKIAATGSLTGSVLKCIAVSGEYRGEGLAATVVTELANQAARQGLTHLFLFTKPENLGMFRDLGFSEIVSTPDMLFMENRRNGIRDFVSSLRASGEAACDTIRRETGREPVCGAVVANCNPFTLGHRYLIEQALRLCDLLHLFVLSEDRSEFSAEERYRLVRAGTADLTRVLLHPTSDYLISQATFPTYFIKDQAKAADARCELDVRIFGECFAGPLGISRRFAGTEPEDEVTNAYNRTMERILPEYGVSFIEIPRLEVCGEEGRPVSAKTVRQLLAEGRYPELDRYLPESTLRELRPGSHCLSH